MTEDLPEAPKELIDLQSAYMTQLSNEGVKGEWRVKKNITHDDIQSLNANTSDVDAWAILKFAQKYELIAWNEGIKFQKSKQNLFFLDKIQGLETVLKEFATENERLSTLLENALPYGE